MISFATLLLGIVVGVVDVTVLVSAEIAAVELRVDGQPVERLEDAPWTFSVDLGERPSPRELVAVAFDADGHELGQARQWVNMPRAVAELDVSLTRGRGEDGISATVTCASVRGGKPPVVRATLDGKPLDVRDPSRIALPPVDLEVVHFLRVEAELEDGSVSHELVFGGEYIEQAHAELSSVAISLNEPGEVGRGDVMMSAEGTEVPVVVIEKGPVDLIVVVDPRALATMPGLTAAAGATRDRRLAHAAFRTDKAVTPRQPDLNLRLLWGVPLEPVAASDYRLFPSTPPDSPPSAGGLLWSLASAGFPGGRGEARIPDAVAVAGTMAIERGRRRAVVLLLGGSPRVGRYGGEGARAYLRDLRVPLYIWSTRRVSQEDLQEWGDITVLGGTRDLARAWQELNEDLERQRVAWVEGAHLPKALEVSTGKATVAGVQTR